MFKHFSSCLRGQWLDGFGCEIYIQINIIPALEDHFYWKISLKNILFGLKLIEIDIIPDNYLPSNSICIYFMVTCLTIVLSCSCFDKFSINLQHKISNIMVSKKSIKILNIAIIKKKRSISFLFYLCVCVIHGKLQTKYLNSNFIWHVMFGLEMFPNTDSWWCGGLYFSCCAILNVNWCQNLLHFL